jgi:hypothetical protein
MAQLTVHKEWQAQNSFICGMWIVSFILSYFILACLQ